MNLYESILNNSKLNEGLSNYEDIKYLTQAIKNNPLFGYVEDVQIFEKDNVIKVKNNSGYSYYKVNRNDDSEWEAFEINSDGKQLSDPFVICKVSNSTSKGLNESHDEDYCTLCAVDFVGDKLHNELGDDWRSLPEDEIRDAVRRFTYDYNNANVEPEYEDSSFYGDEADYNEVYTYLMKESSNESFDDKVRSDFELYLNDHNINKDQVTEDDINDYFTGMFYNIETEEDLDDSNRAEELIRKEYLTKDPESK